MADSNSQLRETRNSAVAMLSTERLKTTSATQAASRSSCCSLAHTCSLPSYGPPVSLCNYGAHIIRKPSQTSIVVKPRHGSAQQICFVTDPEDQPRSAAAAVTAWLLGPPVRPPRARASLNYPSWRGATLNNVHDYLLAIQHNVLRSHLRLTIRVHGAGCLRR